MFEFGISGQNQSGRTRGLSEHQRINRSEVGDRRKKPRGIALKLLNIVECNGLDVLV
jgi:hypothetical protein